MSYRRPTPQIQKAVDREAPKILLEHGYVDSLLLFEALGYLTGTIISRWKAGGSPRLERSIRCSRMCAEQTLRALRQWGTCAGLLPSLHARQTYATDPSNIPARFSRSGNPVIEDLYETRFAATQTGPPPRFWFASKGLAAQPNPRCPKCGRRFKGARKISKWHKHTACCSGPPISLPADPAPESPQTTPILASGAA